MSLAIFQSLSLSLPFSIILVPGTGDFNPAPLLLCLPHPAPFCDQFRGGPVSGLVSQEREGFLWGCVGVGGRGVDCNWIS